MSSIWIENFNIPKHEKLNSDINADVAIVGGGMAGILTAYLLKEKGVDSVILEANRIGMGITKNTTAKITSQHSLIYDNLIQKFGIEKATQYAKANEQAIIKYKSIIEQKNIDCTFEEKPAYVYTLSDKNKIEKEVIAAQKCGINAELTNDLDLPFDTLCAVKFLNQAAFHPLKFIESIYSDLTIYEDTMVHDIKESVLITENGKVTADKIVVATHYPFINSPGYYFIRMHQERSYVLALENAQALDGMYIDESESGYSFRNYENFLLFGGSGHRTGKNAQGGCYQKLESAAKMHYPESTVRYKWSTQDCMSLDGIPYIGQFSVSTPDIFVATGFNKWGMTSCMVSAMVLSDIITNKNNDCAEVFSPQRFNVPASAKNLVEDVKQSVSGLISTGLKVPKAYLENIEKGHGGIVEFEGKKVGIYKDETEKIFTVTVKCPHLGCELSWNPDEKTWDCPCHGSRFEYNGNLIDNPATRGLHNESF